MSNVVIGDYTYPASIAGSTQLDLRTPFGTSIGDLLLVILSNDSGSDGTEFYISGLSTSNWTLVGRIGDSSVDTYVEVWSGISVVSGQYSFTAICNTSADLCGTVLAIEGHDPAQSPTLVRTTSLVSSTFNLSAWVKSSPPAPDPTFFAAWGFDGGDGYPFSVPGGLLTIRDQYQVSTSGNTTSGGIAYYHYPPQLVDIAGNLGDFQIACSAADGLAAIGFLVWPLAPTGVSTEAGTYSHTAALGTGEEVSVVPLGEEAGTFLQATSLGVGEQAAFIGVEAATFSLSTDLPNPYEFTILPGIIAPQISAGAWHGVALTDQGVAIAYGYDDGGEVSSVHGLTGIKFVAAGYYLTTVQYDDGSLVCYGDPSFVDDVLYLEAMSELELDLIESAHGEDFIAYLDASGHVHCFLLQAQTDSWTDVVRITSGRYHIFGIQSDGTVLAALQAGKSYTTNCYTLPQTWSNIKHISTYANMTFAQQFDGTLLQTESTFYFFDPAWDGDTGITSIENIDSKFFIIKEDGTFGWWEWEESSYIDDQVPTWGLVEKMSHTGYGSGFLILNKDNEVCYLGTDVALSHFNGVHLSSIDYSTPRNEFIQPPPFVDLIPVVPTAAYNQDCVFVHRDGTVTACGPDEYGKVGDVSGWSDIQSVAMGQRCTIGINSVGDCVVNGASDAFPYDGMLTDPPTWSNIVAAAACNYNGFGIDSVGDIHITGSTVYAFQTACTPANGWENLVDIAAGNSFVIGLRDDGICLFAGIDTSGIKAQVEAWVGVASITANENTVLGVFSDGTCSHAGAYYTTASRDSFDALTNVKRAFTNSYTTGCWIATHNDGSFTAGGPYTNTSMASWDQTIDWAFIAGTVYWGYNYTTDTTFISIAAKTYSACMLAESNISYPSVVGKNAWYVLALTQSQMQSFGVGVLPLFSGDIADTYFHTQAFGEPFSTIFVTNVEAPAYQHLQSFGKVAEWAYPLSFSHTQGLSEAITGHYSYAGTLLQPRAIPTAAAYILRSAQAGSLKHGYLEDSNGLVIVPIIATIACSKNSHQGRIVLSLGYDDGLLYKASSQAPFYFMVNGEKLIILRSIDWSTYLGAKNKSVVATSSDFSSSRLPIEIVTKSPIGASAYQRAVVVTLADALDIIPNDTITAGTSPPFIVMSSDVYISADKVRSVVYG